MTAAIPKTSVCLKGGSFSRNGPIRSTNGGTFALSSLICFVACWIRPRRESSLACRSSSVNGLFLASRTFVPSANDRHRVSGRVIVRGGLSFAVGRYNRPALVACPRWRVRYTLRCRTRPGLDRSRYDTKFPRDPTPSRDDGHARSSRRGVIR